MKLWDYLKANRRQPVPIGCVGELIGTYRGFTSGTELAVGLFLQEKGFPFHYDIKHPCLTRKKRFDIYLDGNYIKDYNGFVIEVDGNNHRDRGDGKNYFGRSIKEQQKLDAYKNEEAAMGDVLLIRIIDWDVNWWQTISCFSIGKDIIEVSNYDRLVEVQEHLW